VTDEVHGLYQVRVRSERGRFRGRAWLAVSATRPRVTLELLDPGGRVLAEVDAEPGRSVVWLVPENVASEEERAASVLGEALGIPWELETLAGALSGRLGAPGPPPGRASSRAVVQAEGRWTVKTVYRTQDGFLVPRRVKIAGPGLTVELKLLKPSRDPFPPPLVVPASVERLAPAELEAFWLP
jgi:hypothetical protein